MRLTRIFLVGMLALWIPALDHHIASLQAETPTPVDDESCPALDLGALESSTGSGQSSVITSLPVSPDDSIVADCLSDSAAEPTLTPGETVIRAEREWSLLWSDEFEGPAGTLIDSDYWTCETGGEGWGNQELEYYTPSTANVALDGEGFLQITALPGAPDSGETCWYGACAYTSARCITSGKLEFSYGWIEARLQIPSGQGLWPAFWMLGANVDQVDWPHSGEIDIMETIGAEPQTVYGTIHGPGYSGANGIGGSLTLDIDLADDFHVYAVEWTADSIRWYLDGVLYSTVTVDDVGSHEWVFDHDYFLLLNVAVGGSWPGAPDDTTTFPQHMRVDYVRVFQPVEGAGESG